MPLIFDDSTVPATAYPSVVDAIKAVGVDYRRRYFNYLLNLKMKSWATENCQLGRASIFL